VTFISATILLLLVMDPVGNAPFFMSCLSDVPRHRQKVIILREGLIAYGVLVAFLLFGRYLLEILHLSEESMRLAGGIVLFLIAIKMVFPTKGGMFGETPDGEPFIFPLAIPLIAGPSALATVLLFASQDPDKMLEWVGAVTVASVITTSVLFFSSYLVRFIGMRAMRASERLMGMLLTAIAVEMIVSGIKQSFGL
jgi:MarC family membrane protein